MWSTGSRGLACLLGVGWSGLALPISRWWFSVLGSVSLQKGFHLAHLGTAENGTTALALNCLNTKSTLIVRCSSACLSDT